MSSCTLTKPASIKCCFWSEASFRLLPNFWLASLRSFKTCLVYGALSTVLSCYDIPLPPDKKLPNKTRGYASWVIAMKPIIGEAPHLLLNLVVERQHSGLIRQCGQVRVEGHCRQHRSKRRRSGRRRKGQGS